MNPNTIVGGARHTKGGCAAHTLRSHADYQELLNAESVIQNELNECPHKLHDRHGQKKSHAVIRRRNLRLDTTARNLGLGRLQQKGDRRELCS